MPKKPVIGIDLGGTNIQIGVVSHDGKIAGAARLKTKAAEGRDAVLDRIAQGVAEACADAKVAVADCAAAGLGAPGPIDPGKGVVLEAVNLGWKNEPIAQLLSKRLKLPVVLDNDVNAAIYGEWRLGAAKGCKDVMGVWIGTGIGGGLILKGELYYGHFFTAGEIGHMIALPNNMPGSRSLEHNCSRTAVVERIVRLIKSGRKSSITSEVGDDFEKVKSKTLARAYEAGDELTREVVDHSAELLGIHVAGVVTLLSLPRVVLGGGLTEAIGKPYVRRVEDAVRRFAFPDSCKSVDVVASELEDDAGVFGAAMLAVDRAS